MHLGHFQKICRAKRSYVVSALGTRLRQRPRKRIIPMADAICNGPPPSFVREDLGVAATLARYLTKLSQGLQEHFHFRFRTPGSKYGAALIISRINQ